MRAICFGSSRFQPANIVVPSFINCLHSVCSFLVIGKKTRISGSGALTRFHEYIYNVERRGYISCFSINNVFVHCPNKTNTTERKTIQILSRVTSRENPLISFTFINNIHLQQYIHFVEELKPLRP